MREIVFARPRHHYDSYIDFWRLVEASGFRIVSIDEIDPADGQRIYIFTPINGEVQERLPDFTMRDAKIVWWNLERWEDETRERSMLRVRGLVDAIWTSDRSLAAKDPRLHYVLLAGHRHFGSRVLERQYDVCHLSYLWGRRKDAIGGMAARGLRIAPEAWGRAQQDLTVARSRLMVNMHQYEGMTVIAPIRFAVAASYAIPIISEEFTDRGSDRLVLARGPLWQLGNLVADALKEPDRLRVAGQRLFEEMCMYTDFGLQVRYEARRI